MHERDEREAALVVGAHVHAADGPLGRIVEIIPGPPVTYYRVRGGLTNRDDVYFMASAVERVDRHAVYLSLRTAELETHPWHERPAHAPPDHVPLPEPQAKVEELCERWGGI